MATQETKNGLNCIIQAITNIVDPKVANLKYDKTYRAKITEKIDAGVYKVQINGKEYQLSYNGTLSVGDIVKVKAPLNNFSDIYIETVPSSGGGTGGTSDYNDLTNKPQLNTNSSVSQATSSNEIIKGTIKLHKISKTGNYNDLLNKPNVEDGAQVNVIETIQKNGVDLPISNKTVNITVPTKTSDLTNNSGFLSELPIASKTQLGGIKVGNNLTITADGILNATGGGTGSNEVDISETEPTEDTVELWVDLSESDIAGDAQIIDNLESTSTTDALSANQGRILNNKIDNLTTVYTGTNIIASTCEGFGKMKKLYGKTEETGEGEKSPNNPYQISCVADDVNLFNIQNKRILNNIMLNSISDKSIIFTSNGTGVNRQVFIECYLPVGTYTVQRQYEVLSGTKTNSSGAVALYLGSTWKKALMSASQESATFTITEANTYRIRLSANDSDTMTDNIKIEFSNVKIQKGEVKTEYSPYGEGTVKITSTDRTNTSNKVITCKPLCCLKDSEGNIVAQDYIDFARQKTVRQCGYKVLNGTESWRKSGLTTSDVFVLDINEIVNVDKPACCNYFNYKKNYRDEIGAFGLIKGKGTSATEDGSRICVNFSEYNNTTIDAFKTWLSTHNLIIVFPLAETIEEDIDTTNSIVQYANETTISNSDNAEMEVELTKNKAISSINENIGNLQEKDNDLNDKINEVNTNLNDKITNLTTYSTKEVKTGETWINGKPIYRKVISKSITNYTGEITVNLGTSNINTFVNGKVLIDTADFTAIDTCGSSTAYYIRKWVYRKTNNTVTITTNVTGSFTGTIYVIVEYTKTTD